MQTVYIAPTGDDTTGDGSTGNPWLTITKAVAETTVGDTIIAKAGTHAWNTIGNLNGNRILRGETGNRDDVIFDGNEASFTWIIANAFSAGIKETTVKDITFKSLHATDTGNRIVLGSASATAQTLIDNCVFHDIQINSAAASGQLFAYGNNPAGNITNTLFRTCTIYDITRAPGAGNSFLLLSQGNMGNVRVVFDGCTIYLDGTDPINNISRFSAGVGADIEIKFRNSIVVNATNGDIQWQNGTSELIEFVFDHSNIYASPNSWTSLPSIGGSSTTVDPLFISPSSPDRELNLKPGSPLFKAGTKI